MDPARKTVPGNQKIEYEYDGLLIGHCLVRPCQASLRLAGRHPGRVAALAASPGGQFSPTPDSDATAIKY